MPLVPADRSDALWSPSHLEAAIRPAFQWRQFRCFFRLSFLLHKEDAVVFFCELLIMHGSFTPMH